MNWKEVYKDRFVSADEAVKHIKYGDKIIVADWIGEPPEVMRALVRRAPQLKNISVIHGLSPGPNTHIQAEYEKSFRHISLFMGSTVRKADLERRVEYLGGTTINKWPEMFAVSPDLNPHWAFISVTPPDENGMCSFSVSCSFTYAAAKTAKYIVAQINEDLPVLGGQKISIDEIDFPVCYNEPPYTVPNMEVDDITARLADHVAGLIEDGATIQLGFGSLPNAIATRLIGKKDLGVHSETLTENLMDLIEAGVITNAKKTIHKGVCIGTQAAGTERFYKYIDKNPMFAIHPVEYVNDPYIIGQNYKMTSVNACITVDLLGQNTADCIGGRQYSGIGGQLDHVRGAQLSPGGKSILALPSTTKNDTVSKIVAYHDQGTAISVSRYDIDYVVTEYGVAHLKYKTLKQRAKALIGIAHPKFREELERNAWKRGLL